MKHRTTNRSFNPIDAASARRTYFFMCGLLTYSVVAIGYLISLSAAG